MLICSATQGAEPAYLVVILSSIVSSAISVVLTWFLKELSDRRSATKAFDHRIRLEKEYDLYSDLWDKLFELRRATSDLVTVLSADSVRHGEQFLERFNAYQGIVRKGEPFMSESVYEPARKIVTIARSIHGNVGGQERILDRIQRSTNPEMLETKLDPLDDENEAAIEEIENLFKAVATAIRCRVSPA